MSKIRLGEMEVCSGGRGKGGLKREEGQDFKWVGQERTEVLEGATSSWVKSIPGVVSLNPLNAPHHHLGVGILTSSFPGGV